MTSVRGRSKMKVRGLVDQANVSGQGVITVEKLGGSITELLDSVIGFLAARELVVSKIELTKEQHQQLWAEIDRDMPKLLLRGMEYIGPEIYGGVKVVVIEED